MFSLTSQRRKCSAIRGQYRVSPPLKLTARETSAMRTLIISYDLAQPHRNKHILAQQIMALGNSWARPLEQTWYVKTDAREDEIEAQLRGFLDPDDGLLIQATRDEAVMTNTALRWFRQRRAGIDLDGDTNIIAFPMPKPFEDDQQELPLPLAEAC